MEAAAREFIQTEGKWDEVLDLQGGAVWFVLSASLGRIPMLIEVMMV